MFLTKPQQSLKFELFNPRTPNQLAVNKPLETLELLQLK